MIPFRTTTGVIDLERLQPGDVTAEAVADTLSKINRFNGRTTVPWSVASHSVLVSLLAPQRAAAWALLHDAHEMIIGDLTSPAVDYIAGVGTCVGSGIVRGAIHRAKAKIDDVICQAWGVSRVGLLDEVVRADRIALEAEMHVFLNKPLLRGDPDAAEIDRATSLIDELPQGANWRAARAVWIERAYTLARERKMTLPAATQAGAQA